MGIKKKKEELKLLLAKGKIEETIKSLIEEFKGDVRMDDVIHCASRFKALKEANDNGVISFDEYDKRMNQIRQTLIALINGMDVQKEIDTISRQRSIEIEYKRSITRFKLITKLGDQSEGLTIKALQELCELKHRKYLIEILNELKDLDLIERYRQENKSLNRLTDKGRKMIKRLL